MTATAPPSSAPERTLPNRPAARLPHTQSGTPRTSSGGPPAGGAADARRQGELAAPRGEPMSDNGERLGARSLWRRRVWRESSLSSQCRSSCSCANDRVRPTSCAAPISIVTSPLFIDGFLRTRGSAL
eukprot:990470-Rhodomonas_salina.5